MDNFSKIQNEILYIKSKLVQINRKLDDEMDKLIEYENGEYSDKLDIDEEGIEILYNAIINF